LLRRRGTPAGGLALLCVVLAMPAHAATPAPDPPPEAVAPEAPPVTRTQPAPVRSAPAVVPPAPVVHRAAPVTRAQPVQKPAAKPKPVVKPKPTKRATVTKRTVVPASADPHDRSPVPLAAFVPTVEELNRGLAAFAGLALAFVALGGAVVLVAARRELAR
jgi:outer membrane biosynthesis protein TonB